MISRREARELVNSFVNSSNRIVQSNNSIIAAVQIQVDMKAESNIIYRDMIQELKKLNKYLEEIKQSKINKVRISPHAPVGSDEIKIIHADGDEKFTEVDKYGEKDEERRKGEAEHRDKPDSQDQL